MHRIIPVSRPITVIPQIWRKHHPHADVVHDGGGEGSHPPVRRQRHTGELRMSVVTFSCRQSKRLLRFPVATLVVETTILYPCSSIVFYS